MLQLATHWLSVNVFVNHRKITVERNPDKYKDNYVLLLSCDVQHTDLAVYQTIFGKNQIQTSLKFIELSSQFYFFAIC